jgi:hypothetical protein
MTPKNKKTNNFKRISLKFKKCYTQQPGRKFLPKSDSDAL